MSFISPKHDLRQITSGYSETCMASLVLLAYASFKKG
ncbi:MAG: hypothetical protein RLZZ28_1394 [Bacteroidota bacterium]